jgi:hypothetical protein
MGLRPLFGEDGIEELLPVDVLVLSGEICVD